MAVATASALLLTNWWARADATPADVLGEAGEQVLSLNKIQRGMYEVKIDDSEKQSSSINISAQKDTIIKFFNSMAKLDDEQVKKIVNFLNEEE